VVTRFNIPCLAVSVKRRRGSDRGGLDHTQLSGGVIVQLVLLCLAYLVRRGLSIGEVLMQHLLMLG
jgi:hypothetical protein